MIKKKHMDPSTSATEYDRVPYPSHTHAQTHPDRLAVLGRLFGLDPAPVTRSRVLEVGCGDGTNLAPMAWTLPGSEFVGLDLASEPIARGLQMTRDLELNNLRLVQADVTELDSGWGRFDYIIAHGFYSWVPPKARQHLLKLCGEMLSPQGIAYVSYNSLPGCHLRNMLREMLLFHVHRFESPQERIEQARALAQFLTQGPESHDPDRIWLKSEAERFLDQAPGLIYHDDLAAINQPLYFTQFITDAQSHGLQYLAEADFFEMADDLLPEPARQTLARLGRNRVLREQYLDFLKCRRFRQTLLCRREAVLLAAPNPEQVACFLVSSSASAAGAVVDLRQGVNWVFETPKGGKCQTDLPAGKAALTILGELWPFPMGFDDLTTEVSHRLERAGVGGEAVNSSRAALGEFLLRLYAGGIVEFRTWLPPVARQPGLRPLVAPVARWQAAKSEFVASLFHIPVKVEDRLGRRILTWLDGHTDRAGLLQKIRQWSTDKDSTGDGEQGDAKEEHDLESRLEENLRKLARLGLLTADERSM